MVAQPLVTQESKKAPPLARLSARSEAVLFSKVLENPLFSEVLAKNKDDYLDTHCIKIIVLTWCG